ncbi:MAG: bifunctional transaldolase/phosoglucose isomerase [Elusimicrobiota bacterium]
MTNPLKQLSSSGQSPWYDNISRPMLTSGRLKSLIDGDGLKGVTSNPSIFENSISKSADYDADIRESVKAGVLAPESVYERLALHDIGRAADLLLPVYEASDGTDGFVSIEVSPRLAYQARQTVSEAKRLFAALGRRNIMIKVPATLEGLEAVTELIANGVNVNVTLVFSIDRYARVMEAYLAGLEKFDDKGGKLKDVASVASFFVSRIDTAADKLLAAKDPKHPLRGKAAVANCKVAYQAFRKAFSSPRFEALKSRGARVQKLLWASTGTKNPAYSDLLYVTPLIGPDTINTMPPATWDAFRDHGRPEASVEQDVDKALKTLQDLHEAGVDLVSITRDLEKAGVEAFTKAFESLLAHIADKVKLFDSAVQPQDSQVMRRLWDRDVTLWKGGAAAKSVENSLGWLEMPEVMPERVAELEAFSREVREAGFEHVMVLGMGGSSLAPEVLRRTFGPRQGHPRLHVLDSTEAETVASLRSAADPAKTLYIVASKSGTTTEPMRFMDYFWEQVKTAGGGGKNFIAITDPGTAMETHAKKQGFRKVFLNFSDIGGRYSALSYFGMVPAALSGVDVKTLLARARSMAQACSSGSRENPGYKLGMWLAGNAAEGRDKITFLVSPEIESLGLWLEQLIAESVGKEGKGVVPVTGEPLDIERLGRGADRAFVHIRLEAGAAGPAAEAARRLEKDGHPVLTLTLKDRLDLGAEFFRWEIATAVLGYALGIDPFDQPDVQAAKDKTKALLAELQAKGTLPVPQEANYGSVSLSFSEATRRSLSGTPKSLEDALSRWLADSKPNDYLGLLAYIASDGRYDAALSSLRKALAGAVDHAIQSGYGPRYLHSTGQLHKGGPDKGNFLMLARADAPEVALPGLPYGFAKLCYAQALGDFQALDGRDRRAVFIRLQGDVKAALAQLTEAVQKVRTVKA